MIKLLLSAVILFTTGSAVAEMIFTKNNVFCGKAQVFELADRPKVAYKGMLVMDRPNSFFTQELLDGLTASDEKLAIWFIESPFLKEELYSKIETGKCYCVEGEAAGTIDILGFQIVTNIEEATCAVAP